ncbi:polysaccharide deacetylase family protein [Parasphingopyxis marina]|uniref:Deacetylase PdaC domain-containing protein n=1 Tax=Parasphingopyxis marina TaxID=2761622 RepID=A0A842HZ58_9SPHN|nr:DUF3298 and DUF4163 domain-containing protein [Parasphingopyxis marina]MBC2778222.1 hypothetical protein [Parasphingopyxis marina]
MAVFDPYKLLAAAIALGALAAPAPAQPDDSHNRAESEPSFEYHLPGAAMALPGLAEQLGAEREQARMAFEERQAEQAQTAIDFPDYPAPPLIYSQDWGIAGLAGRLMSLASHIYRYDGGAHGNSEFAARLWDVEADRGTDFPNLFTDRYAAYAIVDRAYCPQLQAMQAERGIAVDEDEFWGRCPLLHEQTIFPVGEEGGAFTHIAIRIAPYVAGPYVAGEFEIDVPVTQPLIDLLAPRYRDAFALPEG